MQEFPCTKRLNFTKMPKITSLAKVSAAAAAKAAAAEKEYRENYSAAAEAAAEERLRAAAAEQEAMQAVITASSAEEAAKRFYKADTEKEILSLIGLGVAKSYDNPNIAAARKVRRGVYFYEIFPDGRKSEERHAESVRKSYDFLKIDYAGHIPFRGRLRKEENAAGLHLTKGERKFFFRDSERLLAPAPAEAAVPAPAPAEAAVPEEA